MSHLPTTCFSKLCMERKNNDSKSLGAINIDRRANGRKNIMKTIQSNRGTIALLFVQLSSRVRYLQRGLASCQYDLKYHTKIWHAWKGVWTSSQGENKEKIRLNRTYSSTYLQTMESLLKSIQCQANLPIGTTPKNPPQNSMARMKCFQCKFSHKPKLNCKDMALFLCILSGHFMDYLWEQPSYGKKWARGKGEFCFQITGLPKHCYRT